MFPVTEEKRYATQDTVVIRMLQTRNNYTLENAARIWYTSRTRKKIQGELKLTQISGAQCWNELMRELTHHESWMQGYTLDGP